MKLGIRTLTLIITGGLAVFISGVVAGGHIFPTFAQRSTGNLQVDPQLDKADPTTANLTTRIVMVSVLKGENVVQQKEVGMSDVPLNFTLPVGVYDVRVEGDGVATHWKRGVHVTADNSTNLLPAMRSGPGVCECRLSK